MAKGINISGSLKHSSINISRYIRHKLGKTPEEIAEEDKVRPSAVLNSIASVDAFRQTHTVEFLNEAMIDVVMQNKDKLQRTLSAGLTATKINEKGKKVADHTTQQKAFENAAKLVDTLQPKPTKGISVNVKQQTAVAQGSPPPESGFTDFEARIRNIRAKVDRYNQLPSTTGTVIDDDAEIQEDKEEEVTVDVGSSPHTQG